MTPANILPRIDQRLAALGIRSAKAELRAGRRDAIRNLRRGVARGTGGVTMRTLMALAPALETTAEWLATGHGKMAANELGELIPFDEQTPLDDAEVIEAFGWAFQRLIGKDTTASETAILARGIIRVIRLPAVVIPLDEKRALIDAAVRLFEHRYAPSPHISVEAGKR